MEKDLKLLAAYPDLNVNIRTKYYSDNIGLFKINYVKVNLAEILTKNE